MKRRFSVLLWILGFICLDAYANLVPKYLPQTKIWFWILYWAGFFIITFLVSKYILKLNGLRCLGLQFHKRWAMNMISGFLIGALVFFLKYLCYYGLGMFTLSGWMNAAYITQVLGTAFLAMFFASAINDTLVRGYWLAFCNRTAFMKWYVLLVTILYALDDSWNEGLNVSNMVYSVVLGVSLAYSVYKTRSIWMSIGLHWGSNVLFRAMYGFNNQGVLKLDHVEEGIIYYYAGLLITALMFPIVYLLLRNPAWYGKQPEHERLGALS
jgi:hypothetical protein